MRPVTDPSRRTRAFSPRERSPNLRTRSPLRNAGAVIAAGNWSTPKALLVGLRRIGPCFFLLTGASQALAKAPPPRPPRVDGIHLGVALEGQTNFIRVSKETKRNPYSGGGLSLWVGEKIFPWFSMGLRIGFSRISYKDRSVGMGWLQLDAGFYPFHRYTAKEHQFSLRARTGLGGGFITVPGQKGRKALGGAALSAALRYEWFPWARCNRPRIGGGLAFAPEVSVTGYPPVSKDSSVGLAVEYSVAVVYHFGS